MGKRRYVYVPEPFETASPNNKDTSANLYHSMLCSPAFKALTPRQRLLYLYMKDQYYRPDRNSGLPEKYKGDREYFTFNEAKWMRGKRGSYELYSNKASFYADRDALVEKGFIRMVENNRTQRTSNVYQFTSEWRNWGV